MGPEPDDDGNERAERWGLFHSRFGIDRGHREKELGRFRSVLWFGAGAFPEGIGSVERLASIGDRD